MLQITKEQKALPNECLMKTFWAFPPGKPLLNHHHLYSTAEYILQIPYL